MFCRDYFNTDINSNIIYFSNTIISNLYELVDQGPKQIKMSESDKKYKSLEFYNEDSGQMANFKKTQKISLVNVINCKTNK